MAAEADLVKTTVELPRALWRKAKLKALDDGDLRTVMIRALEQYLGKGGAK